MMNKKRLPHIITAVSLVFFIVLGLASAASTPSPTPRQDLVLNGEESKLLEGTIWALGGIKVEFHPSGKLIAKQQEMSMVTYGGNPNVRIKELNGSWERIGTDVKYVFRDRYGSEEWYLEGKFDPGNFTISGASYIFFRGEEKQGNATLKFYAPIDSANRYINGFDTALFGRWYAPLYFNNSYILNSETKTMEKDNNKIHGYYFYAGNFTAYKVYGKNGDDIDFNREVFTDKDIVGFEKGTYTTDDKGTITFKVTHTFDRTENKLLSKDEFTARQKAQGKTTAQINEAIKVYFPDRSVKYIIGSINDKFYGDLLGGEVGLNIKENIRRNGDFTKE